MKEVKLRHEQHWYEISMFQALFAAHGDGCMYMRNPAAVSKVLCYRKMDIFCSKVSCFVLATNWWNMADTACILYFDDQTFIGLNK